MKQNLSITGNKAYYSGLASKFKTLLQDEIVATNEDVANKARGRVPVDKGFLKNSIITQQVPNGAETLVTVNYAPFIEFGTGGLVDVPTGLEDYAIRFKGEGIKQVNLRPQPFLFNSFKEETIEMTKRLKNAIK